jgi:tetratricopeptide (TPR) repeat protein
MKKLLVLIAGVMAFGTVMGQSNKVVTAYNLMKPEYNELDKAKIAIDEASVHPKTSMESKTWYYRGQVYYKIFQSKDEKIKNLDPDPLKVAYQSFVRAKELDVKNRFVDELKFELTRTAADFFNRGSAEFEQKKFAQSVESFETVVSIGKLPYINLLDTGAIYNAALAADEAGMKEKAMGYYRQTADFNYGGSEVYHYIAVLQMKDGDTVSALKTYEEGIKKYPNSSVNLYVATINVFLEKKNLKSAFSYIEKALEKDPTNVSLWRVYGDALVDKDIEKAVAAYKKMIELEPDNFNGYYMVGYVYFNRGVEENDKANAIPLNDEVGYKAAVTRADDQFKLSLPYFEKAYELKKDDSDLLTGLKQLYYRFKDNDKLKEVQTRIDALK